jgi:xanthine dehydrogenase small subunit
MPKPDTRFAFYKIAKRVDQDISAVCAGIAVTLNEGLVEQARIAYGGMAATPRRALKTEQALTGQRWSEESLEAALRRLPEDFTPLSDMRASAAYRSTVAANLLRRFWYESQGEVVTRTDTAKPVQVNGPILQ